VQITGYIFDVYNFESDVFVWLKDEKGISHLLRDTFFPQIFAQGDKILLEKLTARLIELEAIAEAPIVLKKRHFYKDELIDVFAFKITRPSVMQKIKQKLHRFTNRLDIYHTDIEVPNAYMHEKNIYPLAPVRVTLRKPPLWNYIAEISALENNTELNYKIPHFRILEMNIDQSHRLPISPRNAIICRFQEATLRLTGANPLQELTALNRVLYDFDPDIILTAHGDQKILPELFEWAARSKINLALDRDQVPGLKRNIRRKGFSVNTYGSWIFRAASLPLYGRWHIDSGNSFVFTNSALAGIIELSRLSRTSVQRIARTSTGAALTNMETHVAIANGYLVPWQKSKVESWRSVYAMIEGDKGGMIFQPLTRDGNVYENVVQLDFSQMYPSIMVLHNLSPETVNCPCCGSDPDVPRAPESNWHICKRRRGVVSETLEHVLARRKHYKGLLKTTRDPETEAKQSALKWMLVTSFGYLGYRNAKFGRLESHESVTGFGREKLLRAKEIAEDSGYEVLHAITDSIFIKKSSSGAFLPEELRTLCDAITAATNVEMAIEGEYHWLIFLPSKTDSESSVANRYMGLFKNGEIKTRGIFNRRKDIPTYIKRFQDEILSLMRQCYTISSLRDLHSDTVATFNKYQDEILTYRVPWQEMLIRRTASRAVEDYAVATATALALQALGQNGIDIQPGEKLRYLVLNSKARNPNFRYISEEIAVTRFASRPARYDIDYYRKLLVEAYSEVFAFFAPKGYLDSLSRNFRQQELFPSFT